MEVQGGEESGGTGQCPDQGIAEWGRKGRRWQGFKAHFEPGCSEFIQRRAGRLWHCVWVPAPEKSMSL